MYFANINDKNQKVKTLITQKIHLIDNFKTNIFIDNDVLKFEFIDILTSTNSIFIENCEITILIRTQIKTFQIQHMPTIKLIIVLY